MSRTVAGEVLTQWVIEQARVHLENPGHVAIVVDSFLRADRVRLDFFALVPFDPSPHHYIFSIYGTNVHVVPVGSALAGSQFDAIVIHSVPEDNSPLAVIQQGAWLHEVLACRLKPDPWHAGLRTFDEP